MKNKTRAKIFSVLSKIFMSAMLVSFIGVCCLNDKLNYRTLFLYGFILLTVSIVTGFIAVIMDRWKEYYERKSNRENKK